ncbi:MAG: glucuronate isomerase [Pirellulales bacterium]|nr:glucuronate isomerase [Pirellulales bacterium]
MPNAFITNEFLLSCPPAVELYHRFAKDMPIIDYHCHLPPQEIVEDRRFENLTRIWLGGDHYKWRLMRAAGVPERWITGDAPDREKFQKWAETVPQTLGNAMYHWTHLELARVFGVSDRLLDPQTAEGIWQECNAKLAEPEYSSRSIIRRFNVRLLCTTDDPVDGLEEHARIASDKGFSVQVLPAFRPDQALALKSPADFNAWVEKLAVVSNLDIQDNYTHLLEALRRRHDFFHQRGCRLSDQGIETFWAEEYTETEVREVFRRLRQGKTVSPEEIVKYRSAVLFELAVMNHEKGWAQQYHYGVLRNVNRRGSQALGPDTGYDCIGDFTVARSMARFLDRLDRAGKLAKTIVYNINPRDNDMVPTILGCFQDGSVPGKMQFGSGWWFLDQKDGMQRQLRSLANHGLLGRFVGMLTDSRSFLSYTRHEYFRRVLCNLLGQEMQAGLLPNDFELVGGLVRDICYNNAERYFAFPQSPAGERDFSTAAKIR